MKRIYVLPLILFLAIVGGVITSSRGVETSAADGTENVTDASEKTAANTVKNRPKPEYGTLTVGGVTYGTMEFDSTIFLLQNMHFDVGQNAYYNNNSWFNSGYGRLYSWQAAETACECLGLELPSEEFLRNVNHYFAPVAAGEGSYEGFNPIRAYGVHTKGGESKFNAVLGGVGFFDPTTETGISFTDLDSKGGIWTSTASSQFPNQRVVFLFDQQEGTAQFYSEPIDYKLYNCRCVKVLRKNRPEPADENSNSSVSKNRSISSSDNIDMEEGSVGKEKRDSDQEDDILFAIVATAGSNLNIREQPTQQSSKLTSVPNGFVVEVLELNVRSDTINGVSGNWWRISYGPVVGYCFSPYLRLVNEDFD